MSEIKKGSFPAELESLLVFPFLDDIAFALRNSESRFLVVTAETAAGKSTGIPLALLESFSGKILMTEPRRLAVTAVASRIAALLGEDTGETVGYRLRFESHVSKNTRLEVVTDAILTRKLQNEPALDGVSVVILDEFHERSVHTDLTLAFLKEIMQLRDDLFVLVMSATIDLERVAAFLGGEEPAPVVVVPGRRFPVEIEYRSPVSLIKNVQKAAFYPGAACMAEVCAATVMSELFGSADAASGEGTVLVFLPGIADIRKCCQILKESGAEEKAEILMLHSSVPFDLQRKVLSPVDSGRRRVVVSSAVAETSLTVPDVTVVVDSGLARVNRFDARSGMERLVTETESVFSAEQRAGRAGRMKPGRCIRLWAQSDARLASFPPEICRADLLPVVLECALWGCTNVDALAWLDMPSAGSWQAAVDLLQYMDCLDFKGAITQKGKAALSLGVHPRIACVALGNNKNAVDIAVKYAVADASSSEEARRLKSDLSRRISKVNPSVMGKKDTGCISDAMSLLSGFPDRIARSEGGGLYQFPSGRKATLSEQDCNLLATFPKWIVAPDTDAGERTGKIFSWEPLDEATVEKWLASRVRVDLEVVFEEIGRGSRKVRKTEYSRYGRLTISSRRIEPDASDTAAAVCSSIRSSGLESLPWSMQSRLLVLRARFQAENTTGGFHSSGGECPSALERYSDSALLASLEDWLLPFLPATGNVTAKILEDALFWHCGGASLDSKAPLIISLPNGKKRKLTYEVIAGKVEPVLEVIVQDMFGCAETPLVSGTPVLLRLLSPARRPLQVTRDLAGFWRNTWPEVCREMKGRYPKHDWSFTP